MFDNCCCCCCFSCRAWTVRELSEIAVTGRSEAANRDMTRFGKCVSYASSCRPFLSVSLHNAQDSVFVNRGVTLCKADSCGVRKIENNWMRREKTDRLSSSHREHGKATLLAGISYSLFRRREVSLLKTRLAARQFRRHGEKAGPDCIDSLGFMCETIVFLLAAKGYKKRKRRKENYKAGNADAGIISRRGIVRGVRMFLILMETPIYRAYLFRSLLSRRSLSTLAITKDEIPRANKRLSRSELLPDYESDFREIAAAPRHNNSELIAVLVVIIFSYVRRS